MPVPATTGSSTATAGVSKTAEGRVRAGMKVVILGGGRCRGDGDVRLVEQARAGVGSVGGQ